MITRSDRFLVAFLSVWNVLLVLFWVVGLHGWFWMWLAIEAVVALAELVSKVKTGRTVTQNFRQWAATHLWQAASLLLLMASAWALLLLHLGVR